MSFLQSSGKTVGEGRGGPQPPFPASPSLFPLLALPRQQGSLPPRLSPLTLLPSWGPHNLSSCDGLSTSLPSLCPHWTVHPERQEPQLTYSGRWSQCLEWCLAQSGSFNKYLFKEPTSKVTYTDVIGPHHVPASGVISILTKSQALSEVINAHYP